MLKDLALLIVGFAATLSAQTAQYTGSAACKTCHPRSTSAGEDPHGERGARSQGASGRDHSRSQQGRSGYRHVHQGRHRVRLRQQVEAALLHEGRRRLLSLARAVGRGESKVEPLLRSPMAPTGGRLTTRPTTCSAPPARCATAATRSTTTSRPRPSPNGTWAAKSATDPAACTSPGLLAPTSSIPRAWALAATTSASSATRRASRWRIRSRGSTTIGRSASTVTTTRI